MDENLPLTLEKLGITAEDLRFNMDKIIYNHSASQQEMIKAINMRTLDIPVIENPIFETNNLLKLQNLRLSETNSFLEKQLKEAKESNSNLSDELQDLKQQIIALQTKPKQWYQKIGGKILLAIGTLISLIIGGIISQAIAANWDTIVGFIKK